jgi:hypothetical protein
LLELLGERALTRRELLAALNARYEVTDAAEDLLAARLDELIAVGLVHAV